MLLGTHTIGRVRFPLTHERTLSISLFDSIMRASLHSNVFYFNRARVTRLNLFNSIARFCISELLCWHVSAQGSMTMAACVLSNCWRNEWRPTNVQRRVKNLLSKSTSRKVWRVVCQVSRLLCEPYTNKTQVDHNNHHPAKPDGAHCTTHAEYPCA